MWVRVRDFYENVSSPLILILNIVFFEICILLKLNDSTYCCI